MAGSVYDVPSTKKCCSNCAYAFINVRKELKGMKEFGKFPLCTCRHEAQRKILQDPRKDSCEEFKYREG